MTASVLLNARSAFLVLISSHRPFVFDFDLYTRDGRWSRSVSTMAV